MKERKLSKAESERLEKFNEISKDLISKGYKKKDLTVGILKANIVALLLMLPYALILIFAYISVNRVLDIFICNGFIFCLGIIVCTIMHEGIHGLIWGMCASNHMKSISFGVIWSALTPYCTCNEPLKKNQYIIGAIMPTIILGFIMGAVSVVLNNVTLFAIAIIMIFGGGGDFYIILKLLLFKSKRKNVLFYDHPSECGLVVFEK